MYKNHYHQILRNIKILFVTLKKKFKLYLINLPDFKIFKFY